MGKRVLLITRYFPPLDSIATIRLHSWAKGLVTAGHEVTILTTTKKKQILVPLDADLSPYEVVEVDYFDPLVTFGGEKKKVLAAPRNGIKSWALGVYRSRLNERIPGRTDGWVLPAMAQLKRWKREGRIFDTIVSSYGPPAAHIVGCRAKKIFGARWIADYRDLWVENATYKGLPPFTFLEKFLERKCVGRADAITTISDPYRDFLQKKFPSIPCHTITNGFDAERIDRVVADRPLDDVFRIIYTGALYPKTRDPSPLFEAVRALAPTSLRLEFYGGVADGLPALIEKYGLQGIAEYKGCVGQAEAYRLQKESNALLFLEDPNPAVPGVLTGKLFEYLYMDVPILAVGVGSDSSAGQLIEKAGAGVVCGQDVALIRETLRCWLSGTGAVSRNREVIHGFSRVNLAKKLVSLVEAP